MSVHKETLEKYGDKLMNQGANSFEQLQLLQERTEIFDIQQELTFDEAITLASIDLYLAENAQTIVDKIEGVYDFSLSDKNEIPIEQWWWHLDKLSLGHLDFGIFVKEGHVI
ncbi:hypothetical protein H0266_04800 [Halobacillus locisalis]|uniref:Uncharacterized protein n=1 Tax=Halobacillus locisalis TaxID=220753 RepID=A0A838CQX4_9BACI|nr:hypothetical protein [Halobacillus locisalis]MBA2174219.1 hypothetical protein [Halobacillus locisalis]